MVFWVHSDQYGQATYPGKSPDLMDILAASARLIAIGS